MNQTQLGLKFLLFIVFITVSTCVTAQQSSFDEYLASLRLEAEQKGYSKAVLDEAFATIQLREKVVTADKNQPEKKLTLDTYLQTRVPDWKVKQAVEKLQEHDALLTKVAKKYNVQKRFIVALWGNESNFGRIQGSHPVLSSLVSLAYDGRREALFKRQFFAALTILDEGHISVEQFTGSWAGAMGQSQFMPSSFLTYAVDGDGDGKKDIWGTPEDVFASIANFLSQEGWNGSQTWGRQVKLSDNFDKTQINALSGLAKSKMLPLQAWQNLGVTRFDETALPQVNLNASLILPDDINGRIYLVYNNFHTLMRWNRSMYFGVSVGYLADRIRKGS
ncbi:MULTISPECIES: lytic murein transglycosylase [Alteromonadaceae]|uniref:Lytic murein transglycosylase n=1 Tax=Brumicola blandensis TaxID=3075611 RepID=A0AAW8R0X9_9ALTE|nr:MULTISPECIES: lytic murein transglycosylase [unclassified Alteromonas]MDT0581917.1 lytic murein transglycosylase [Alteromonas sp. W409]MDT0628405.1 lytic murein transglycosylase [Alteromonas sp. W364]